jgi:hypothetical protein
MTTIWGMKHIHKSTSFKNGVWNTNLAVGSEDAGMHTRAFIALNGLFALGKSETIYYQTDIDDEGSLLSSNCDYRLEGIDFDARWWSITVYGNDQFLIPNKLNRYSFNVDNLVRERDNSYKIHLSGNAKKKNWLPSGNQQQLYLTIRLYNPEFSVYEHPDKIKLPRIIKEKCQ